MINAIKAELKTMKKSVSNMRNIDYSSGYTSAISTIEGFIAELEDRGCEGCEFEVCEAWEMPCTKCRRGNTDCWRKKK